MYKITVASLTSLTFALLSGCMMVGPDYQQPKTQVAEEWKLANNDVENSTMQDTEWWKRFNDPILDQLIIIGYQNNLSLQSVGVRVLQARAQLAQSVGELYPQQQGISSSLTRQRIASGSEFADVIPSNLESSSMSFSASWEPDFWGKYRRAIQADNATFLSSIAAYDDALVSLTAEIGSAYVAVRLYEAQINLSEKSIALQKQNITIKKTQYTAGQINLSDLEQATMQLHQTEANLPTLKASLQQEKDALAVLLGTTPDKIDPLIKTTQSTIPKAPEKIVVDIPKNVLRQRPDVHQAELEAIAQSEGIGAIKAQLYPAFALKGSFGYGASNSGSSSATDLFQWSNRTYSIGPSVSIPLFNYGQITNQVRAQDAAFQQAIFNYQQVVLNAQKEVQDGIANYTESQKTLQSMTAANNAALMTVALTQVRYEEGEIGYAELIQTKLSQLNLQTSLVNAQANTPQQAISLYRALGGGWQIRKDRDVVSDDVKQEMANRTDWGSLLHTENHQEPNSAFDKIKQTDLPTW